MKYLVRKGKQCYVLDSSAVFITRIETDDGEVYISISRLGDDAYSPFLSGIDDLRITDNRFEIARWLCDPQHQISCGVHSSCFAPGKSRA